MIAITGIGGVGKTAFAVHAVQQLWEVEGGFTGRLWLSLRDAPPLQEVLRRCIRGISGKKFVSFPSELTNQLALFIEYLQRQRYLVILDNFEAILQPGSLSEEYRAGYEEYGKLIDQVRRAQHRSCLLVTSREMPKEMTRLEVEETTVRSLVLPGLEEKEARIILHEHHLEGTDGQFAELIGLYSGNPLALKLVAASIRDMFDRSIDSFLRASRSQGAEEAIMLSDIADLLGQQFQRLSDEERDVMYWLAIEREAVPPYILKDDSVQLDYQGRLFQYLEKLRHRCLIEAAGDGRFTLQPAIMEYVTEDLLSKVIGEIAHEKVNVLASYPLLKARAKDYVRRIQTRVLLAPVAQRMRIMLVKRGARRSSSRCSITCAKPTRVPLATRREISSTFCPIGMRPAWVRFLSSRGLAGLSAESGAPRSQFLPRQSGQVGFY